MTSELPGLAPLVGHAWIIGDRPSAGAIVRQVQSSRAAAAPAAHRFASGDFLIGGGDVGAGEDDVRGALVTLRNVGVAAIIARSFGPRFYDAAIERGLPALVIEESEAIQPGDRLRIDIEEHKIANQSSGDRYIIRNLYDGGLDVLRAGGLAAYRIHQARINGGTHQ